MERERERERETSDRSTFLGEGEAERGEPLPPSSPPCTTPSSHQDVAPRRIGSTPVNAN
jgi:hypothetical protein